MKRTVNQINLQNIKEAAKLFLAVPAVRYVVINTNILILSICSKSKILSAIFASFISRAFLREQKAVLAGRLSYYRNLKSKHVNIATLRRNIHRLEKALIMRPRKSIFALDYIAETVDEYVKLNKEAAKLSPSDLKWATEVLALYFDSVEMIDKIQVQKKRFEAVSLQKSIQNQIEPSDKSFVPYNLQDGQKLSVSYEDLLSLSMKRRSVRWYTDRKVEREKITKAIEVAKLAPSACNRQPFKFLIIDDPVKAKKIASIPFGTGGYSHNIQALAVVVGTLDNYASARDRHVIYIDGSLAAMSFMYALETLGLSSCPINWPDFELLEKKMAKALNLHYHERPVMLIAFGYGDQDGGIPFSAKKDNHDICQFV